MIHFVLGVILGLTLTQAQIQYDYATTNIDYQHPTLPRSRQQYRLVNPSNRYYAQRQRPQLTQQQLRQRAAISQVRAAELAELASGVVNMAAFFGKAAYPENAELLDLGPKVFTAFKPQPPPNRNARAASSPWMSVIGSFLPNNIPLRLENGRPTIRLRDNGSRPKKDEFNLATLWGAGRNKPQSQRTNQQTVRAQTNSAEHNSRKKSGNAITDLIGGSSGPLAGLFKGFGGGGKAAQELLLKPLTEGLGSPIGSVLGLEKNSGRDSVGEDPSEDLVPVWGAEDDTPDQSFYSAPRRSGRKKRSIVGSETESSARREKRAAADLDLITSFLPALLGGGSGSNYDPFAKSLLNPVNLLEFLSNQGDQSFTNALTRGVRSSFSSPTNFLWLNPSGGISKASSAKSPQSPGNFNRAGVNSANFEGPGWEPVDSFVSSKFGPINTKNVDKFNIKHPGVPIISDSDNDNFDNFLAGDGPTFLNDLINGLGDSSNLDFSKFARHLVPKEARPFVDILSNLPRNTQQRFGPQKPGPFRPIVQTNDFDHIDVDLGSGEKTLDDPYYNFYSDS